ncbi:MAG: hypothetical protein ABI760_19700 [Ferruginibacter sp.]
MTEKTKIVLSAMELELVCNKEWILTKRIIIEKVYRLFGGLALIMQQQIRQNKDSLPPQATGSSPKISRGENYRSLPYVMLDYPRYFTKESTLAIRTLFWWGNFFSINLHLSGACREKAIPALRSNFSVLQQKDYWICIHTEPWHHHFGEDNYVPLKNYCLPDFEIMIHLNPFIKLACRISLEQWDGAAEFLEHHFNEMIILLEINFPGDERGLLPGIPIAGSGL